MNSQSKENSKDVENVKSTFVVTLTILAVALVIFILLLSLPGFLAYRKNASREKHAIQFGIAIQNALYEYREINMYDNYPESFSDIDDYLSTINVNEVEWGEFVTRDLISICKYDTAQNDKYYYLYLIINFPEKRRKIMLKITPQEVSVEPFHGASALRNNLFCKGYSDTY